MLQVAFDLLFLESYHMLGQSWIKYEFLFCKIKLHLVVLCCYMINFNGNCQPQQQPDGLVSGSLDLLTMLLKASDSD